MKRPLKLASLILPIFLFTAQSTWASLIPVKVICDLQGPSYDGTLEGPLLSSEWNFSCDTYGYGNSDLYGILEAKNKSDVALNFNGMVYHFLSWNLLKKVPPNVTCAKMEADFKLNGFSDYYGVSGPSSPGTASFSSSELRNVKMNAMLYFNQILPYSFGRQATGFADCNIQVVD